MCYHRGRESQRLYGFTWQCPIQPQTSVDPLGAHPTNTSIPDVAWGSHCPSVDVSLHKASHCFAPVGHAGWRSLVKRYSYRERDYAFGQLMLTLRTSIGLGMQLQVFPAGREAEEIRALWRAAHQKVLLDEAWLHDLVAPPVPLQLFPQAEPTVNGGRAGGGSPVRFQNLPPLLTPLIGREQQEQAISALLLRPEVRLLTLTGTAGIGKTRLAQKVTTDLIEVFTHGVCLLQLAPLSDADLVVSTIAH